MTAKDKARVLWVVQGHGPSTPRHPEISELLGSDNGITCILRATLPSSDLAVPKESTQDTVSENTCVAHQVYKL